MMLRRLLGRIRGALGRTRRGPDIKRVEYELSRCGLDDLTLIAPALSSAINRSAIRWGWMDMPLFRAFERHGIHVTAGSYYSPIPDTRGLPASLWDGKPFKRAMDEVSMAPQMESLERALAWSGELADVPRGRSEGFFWDNEMFPPLDAFIYYGLIRECRPQNIVEVGSGYSTEIALRAMRLNGPGGITCIEPFPSQRLLKLRPDITELVEAGVQDAPFGIFERLSAGDMLFIDTSHTVKAGSDVNHILFKVLPLIRDGVLIHFHDVFLPYEYPRTWLYDIGIMWNEQYALLSFLMHNDRYKALLLNYNASVEYREYLEKKLAGFDIHGLKNNLGGARGASLWLIKGRP